MMFSQNGIKPALFFLTHARIVYRSGETHWNTSIINIILPSITCADRQRCGNQNNTHTPWPRSYPEPISWWGARSRRTAWSWRETPAADDPLWSRLGGSSHPRTGPTRSESADPERWWTTRRERQTSWRDSVISDPTGRQKYEHEILYNSIKQIWDTITLNRNEWIPWCRLKHWFRTNPSKGTKMLTYKINNTKISCSSLCDTKIKHKKIEQWWRGKSFRFSTTWVWIIPLKCDLSKFMKTMWMLGEFYRADVLIIS